MAPVGGAGVLATNSASGGGGGEIGDPSLDRTGWANRLRGDGGADG